MRLLILLILLLPLKVQADQTSHDTIDAAARALYQQQHWDDDVNEIVKHYERMLTDEQKKWGGYALVVAKVIRDHEVTFKWTFP